MNKTASRAGWLFFVTLPPFGWLVGRFEHLIDDAFISFRYAHNWAAGHGLSYNPGVGEPVEGFSNFLWVALLAGFERLGAVPEQVANIVSVACGALLLWLFHRSAVRDFGFGARSALLGTLFLACFPPFAVWCTGGLETAAFSLALFASWRELCRPPPARPLLAGFLALCVAGLRPEGAIWALGLVLASGVALQFSPDWRGRLKLYLPAVLAGIALLLLCRQLYFGEWVANTTRAKGSLGGEVWLRGLKDLASYFLIFLSPLLVLMLLPRALTHGSKLLLRSALLMLLAGMLSNVAVGGDWMAFFRFLAPLTPFLALLLAGGLERLPRALSVCTGLLAIGLSLLPAFELHLVPASVRERVYFRTFLKKGYETELGRFETSRRNLALYEGIGRALSRVAGPGDSLVMGPIGAIGYYSGVIIHDRNGLVDREVARRPSSGTRSAGHDKRVPRSFFADRRPTWYEMTFLPAPLDEWPLSVHARMLFERVTAVDPEERALLGLCYPERIEVPGGALFGLRATDSEAEARAAWNALGIQ